MITGSTGFVGRYILKELLVKGTNDNIVLLVRNDKKKGIPASSRVDKMLRSLLSGDRYEKALKQIRVVEGDIINKDFGLQKTIYKELCESIHVIYHCAATIRFDLTVEKTKEINVNSTYNILEFSKECQAAGCFKRLNHISTAYVSGIKSKKTDNFQKEFINSYESSKDEAEKLVIEYSKKILPVTIYRPSIISGNSKTGEITTTNILYLFLFKLSRELMNEFPCNPDTSLNIIPIDFFLNLMFKIGERPDTIGNIYNITSKTNVKIKELICFICSELNVKIPNFIPISDEPGFKDRFIPELSLFLPYLEESHNFDLTETQNLFPGQDMDYSRFQPGFKNIIRYCLDKNIIREKIMQPVL
jgi:long-chain acyl-CoA synthetase